MLPQTALGPPMAARQGDDSSHYCETASHTNRAIIMDETASSEEMASIDRLGSA
jgi:hypothetical protein